MLATLMNLTDLKTKSTQELMDLTKEIGLDHVGRSRKQDIIFSILKAHARLGEDIYGDGVNIAARLEGLAQPGAGCRSCPLGFSAVGLVA